MLNTLTTLIGRKSIRAYWRQKHKFSRTTEPLIDWEVCHRSHKAMEKYRHRWLSKWMTGFCGVGYMMAICKFQVHSKCPRCNQDDEKVPHILQCPDARAQDLWQEGLVKLRRWILDNNGPEDMADALYHNLMAWQSFSPFPPQLPESPTLRRALLDQDKLGWFQVFDGFLARSWRAHVQTYFSTIDNAKSSMLWMSRLQNRIWRIPWEMWSHRNNILHHEESTLHQHELVAVNSSIIQEWTRGQATLPNRYKHLFQGTLQSRLADNHHYKRMWLTSVWAARESQGDLLAVLTRNKTSARFFDRWCSRVGSTQRMHKPSIRQESNDSD